MEAGLFGDVKDMGGAGLVSDLLVKQVKLPSAATLSSTTGPKLTKPARPAAIHSITGKHTIKSNFS